MSESQSAPSAPTPRTERVGIEQANQTLSAVLRGWLPGTPWSQVQRMIRKRHILVNGNLCLDAGRRLKTGEIVKVLEHPTAPLPREDDIRIRYLDAQVVVVEKPAGMTSVRHVEERNWPQHRKRLDPTLEEVLPRVLGKKQKTRKPRPGEKRANSLSPVRAVHRLDRETSGLMVFARTVPAERHLGQQFRHHDTERCYLAIVKGTVTARTIRTQLVRDRGDGRRGSTPSAKLGKLAITHVKPIESLGDYTLVECRLETGRTHQIRIHLAELGHPVCGDKVYHQPLFASPIPDTSQAPRLALHATELGFTHPQTGELMKFRMPLPDDLATFLHRLRGEMSPAP